MLTNPLTFSDTKRVNPLSPPEEKTILTDPEFTGQINKFLGEGIKNNHSQDYVAGQIYELVEQNPELAKEHSLTDYQAIKAGVKQVYKFCFPRLPKRPEKQPKCPDRFPPHRPHLPHPPCIHPLPNPFQQWISGERKIISHSGGKDSA